MKKHRIVLPTAVALVGAVSSSALATAPPVGPLPKGPVQTVKRSAGTTFTVTLPKPRVAGRTWRVARVYDARVVREVAEGTTRTGAVWVRYRAVARGTTRIVYALTLGERPHAYAARTIRVVVVARR